MPHNDGERFHVTRNGLHHHVLGILPSHRWLDHGPVPNLIGFQAVQWSEYMLAEFGALQQHSHDFGWGKTVLHSHVWGVSAK